MFYEPGRTASGLPYNPFKSCCVPRPIGWISTVSPQGVHNLAPYSQFQNLTWDPPTVTVAVNCRPDGSMKDTAANALATGEFVWNMATYDLRQWVVSSAQAFGPEVDEFSQLGIPTVPSSRVKPLRVAASPVHFECRLRQSLYIPANTPEASTYLLIGEVIGVHIQEDVIDADGVLDILKIKPLARVGYLDYVTVESKFQVVRPDFEGLDTVPYMQEAMK
ncbi:MULTISPECIES: flavin reductase family protein [unclassified Variovorax]|uniref:flavin reductase family protein n=1 Tax=unclassified Variovorax TaxID=663243 RepID=UPI00257643C8|nr:MULTISPECIES: flavin reductase family protein [unclassified Variovorax]MDM0088211.1 flavin reductase family protein [Variovorax sp. J22G40]MDM0146284.1 flavin reductase family protein [Variovorax sp. J2P1-31]